MRRTWIERSSRQHGTMAASVVCTLALVGAMAACGVDGPTGTGGDAANARVSFAKGGPSGVAVTSVNPDSAYQGDSLVSVRVFGSGFAAGARATWVLNGDTTHVHTTSTTFVSATEVIAVIKVDPDAPVAKYDVAVTLLTGKKGVGAEMFAVKTRGNTDQTTRARFSFEDSVNVGTEAAPVYAPAGVRGDDRLRDGSPPTAGGPSNEYQGNFCGVSAVIGSGTNGEGYQFNYSLDRWWASTLPESCQPVARYLRVYLNGPTGTPGVTSPGQNFSGIGSMVVGESRIQPSQSGTMADLGVGLWFDDAYPPASSVLITRLPNVIDADGRSVRQWRIQTRGTHKAVGVVPNTGKKPGSTVTNTFYYLPWSMLVTEVPYPFPTFP